MSEEKENPFLAAAETLADAGVIDPVSISLVDVVVNPIISELAEQVGLVLGKAQNKLFLRGDIVMKIDYDSNQGVDDFFLMHEIEFVSWAEHYIRFVKLQKYEDENGEKKERKIRVSIDGKKAKLILMSPQFRACLPRVYRKNRVRLPVLRPPTEAHPKGRIELLPVGFDEQSGTYTFKSEIQIDEKLTFKQAIGYYLNLLCEFPLPIVTIEEGGDTMQDPNTIGAIVAGMIAPFVDGILPAHTLRCGFIYTANLSGSGKSLLAKMATAPITGHATGLTLSSKDEKTTKDNVDSALLGGQSSLFFDNVKGFVQNAVLESLMTMPYWSGRAFHSQRLFTVRNETTVFMSGNNVTVGPDITRRFVYINLESDEIDPSHRKHNITINDHWLMNPKNRSEMLSAAWALVRAWDDGGRHGVEHYGGSMIGGFEAWCDVISAIVCNTKGESGGAIGDPLKRPVMAIAGDPETRDMKKLIELAVKEAGGIYCHFRSDEMLAIACEHGLFDYFLPELPADTDINDVVKHKEKVRFGKLITSKSGEMPKGLKYTVVTERGPETWRFSYEGSGRHRRYKVDKVS